MSDKQPQISIVIPLYNEEAGFALLIDRLNQLIKNSVYSIEVILVNDGSRDNTPLLMNELALTNSHYQCVFLARNHGHQLALTAGLTYVSCSEAVFIIDGDLQDPPELLGRFYEKYKEGYEVIYGIRRKRKEGVVKKFAYWFYYRLLKNISSIEIPLDSGDFALLSRRVVDHLNAMPERSRFIRGMRTWIGFRQTGLEYERDARSAGEAKYNLKMLFNLAYNGIFNFSEFPIKFITRLGMLTMIGAFLFFIYVLIKMYWMGGVPPGYASLFLAISIFSGVQLLALGLIGEYVLRIYDQVRARPLFIVDKVIKNKELQKRG
ncbi:MAG: glycosyltransferase [Sphingobacteriales bacterium]|nr:MAG: glycosyltransferase [Sphingobacteriales bacterium]